MSFVSFSRNLTLAFLAGAASLAHPVRVAAAPYPLSSGAEFDGMRKVFNEMSRVDAAMSTPPTLCWNESESAALMYTRGAAGMVLIDPVARTKDRLAAPSPEAAKPEFMLKDNERFIYFSGGSWWSFTPASRAFAKLDQKESREADKRWDVHRPDTPRKGSGETVFIVRNDYGADVGLYWKKGDGTFVPYGTIAAGASAEQNTYAGHAWEVRDSSGRVIDKFSVPQEGGIVTVTARNGSVTKPARPGRHVPKKESDFDTSIVTGALVVKSKAGEFVIPAKLAQAETLAGSYPSGDGDFAAAVCLTKAAVRQLTYTEAHPKGSDKPRVFSFEYAKPGDVIDANRVAIFDLKGRREISVKTDVFDNVWDFRPIGWSPDGSEFVVYLHYRTHQLSRFVGVSRDGTVRTIVEEKAATFIDYSQKGWYSVLNGSWQLLWASERDGLNHIYRFDLKTGALLNKVTTGDYIVHAVDSVDEEGGTILFDALAVRKGEDPYYPNLMRVGIDGTKPAVVLTEGDGFHSWSFSPSRKYLVDRLSRVDLPPSFALRNAATGEKVCDLVTRTAADIPAGYIVPERFTAKGRDGKTDIYGVIYRPAAYKQGDRLPVIEFIYAGPHGYSVPKSWGERDMYMRLSEQGYAVVVIDGMGTNWRDRAFHDVCWMNIRDAGYPDRIAWIKAAAAKHPELDISKVGIIGGSAGGQNSCAALIWHNDFYKVAVSDCGCHDNRIDKIWWNEAWMGWPIGPQYSASSNIDNAAKLKGDILLLLGEIDTNVDIVSTYYLADAFKKNSIPYDLYVVPGAGHFVYFDDEAFRRVSAFFHRNIPVPTRK